MLATVCTDVHLTVSKKNKKLSRFMHLSRAVTVMAGTGKNCGFRGAVTVVFQKQ